MAKIIAVVSHKGGVGKTTTTSALVAGLAAKKKKILAVDLDGQCSLSIIAGAEQGKTALAVLTGDIKAQEAIQHINNFDIIPAHKGLDALAEFLQDIGKEYKLREALEPVKAKYDYIVIDTPPSIGILTVNALTAADEIIIPAQADLLSYEGMKQLVEVCGTVRKYTNPALKIAGILLTRFNGRSIISKDMQEHFSNYASEIGTKLFNVPVREATAIKEAQIMRSNIFDYAPKSNAAKDYGCLVDEISRQQ